MTGRALTQKSQRGKVDLVGRINEKASSHALVRHVETLPFLAGNSVERYTFENGLDVLLLVDRSAPVIAFQAWFRVGSRHERPQKTGLAHLFEHLMFNEVEGLPQGEFDRKMESMGADNNASTWLDFTQYQESFPKQHLRTVLQLEARRMNRLVLREPQLASEKEVVMNERRYRVEDDVEGAAEELLYKTAFSNHPYHAPTIGWMEDIEQLSLEDCRAFYEAYYCPNNATLVLVGDLNERKTLEWIGETYGSIPPSKLPAEDLRYDPPLLEERRVELTQPTATEKLLIGYRGPALGDADHVLCCLVVEILTSGRASRLVRRLVRRTQLANDVSGFVGPHRDPGLIELSFSARKGVTCEQILRIVDEELESLCETLVEPDELERALARMEFGHFSGMETAEGKASQLGFYEVVLRNPTESMARFARLERATPSDVRRIARRYFAPPGRAVLCVRSQGDHLAPGEGS